MTWTSSSLDIDDITHTTLLARTRQTAHIIPISGHEQHNTPSYHIHIQNTAFLLRVIIMARCERVRAGSLAPFPTVFQRSMLKTSSLIREKCIYRYIETNMRDITSSPGDARVVTPTAKILIANTIIRIEITSRVSRKSYTARCGIINWIFPGDININTECAIKHLFDAVARRHARHAQRLLNTIIFSITSPASSSRRSSLSSLRGGARAAKTTADDAQRTQQRSSSSYIEFKQTRMV